MNGTWVRSQQACKYFGVHPNTLRRWANSNNVNYKTTVGGQRLYLLSSDSSTSTKRTEKEIVLYVRVSSSKQKDDLQRQVSYVSSRYPNCRIVKDIGSGLNLKRKGLIKLLEQASNGLIQTVVVTSKDRLCRFGFELLQWLFERENVQLVVLDKVDKSPEQEFTEDILAILQVFACRWNGRRNYSIKKQKDQITVELPSDEAPRTTSTQPPIESKQSNCPSK